MSEKSEKVPEGYFRNARHGRLVKLEYKGEHTYKLKGRAYFHGRLYQPGELITLVDETPAKVMKPYTKRTVRRVVEEVEVDEVPEAKAKKKGLEASEDAEPVAEPKGLLTSKKKAREADKSI